MSEDSELPAFLRFLKELDLPDRAIATLSASAFGLLGFWIGLMSVPDSALDVPKLTTQTRSGQIVEAAFLPVPNWAIPMTVIVFLITAWLTWTAIRPVVMEGSS